MVPVGLLYAHDLIAIGAGDTPNDCSHEFLLNIFNPKKDGRKYCPAWICTNIETCYNIPLASWNESHIALRKGKSIHEFVSFKMT